MSYYHGSHFFSQPLTLDVLDDVSTALKLVSDRWSCRQRWHPAIGGYGRREPHNKQSQLLIARLINLLELLLKANDQNSGFEYSLLFIDVRYSGFSLLRSVTSLRDPYATTVMICMDRNGFFLKNALRNDRCVRDEGRLGSTCGFR